MSNLVPVPLERLAIGDSYLHYSGNPYLPGPNLVTVRNIWNYTSNSAIVYTDNPAHTFVVYNYDEPLDPKNRFYTVPVGPYPIEPPEDLGDAGMERIRQILAEYNWQSEEDSGPDSDLEKDPPDSNEHLE